MSAIPMKCSHCQTIFFVGMVGTTMFPPHVCPDGTKGAPTEYVDFPHAPEPPPRSSFLEWSSKHPG